jgi:cyclopropane fatty-acyl-phospholipid synthase-like methyltransferase
MAVALGPQIASFKRRFHAWWEGHDYAPDPSAGDPGDGAEEGAGASAAAAAAPESPPPDAWSPQRVRVSEMIWGDGFNFPGGAEAALKIIHPLGLNKEKTLLDIGCGLGGGARAVAKTLGAWVDGLEPSGALAAAGMKLSEAAGLGSKAAIKPFDLQVAKLPTKRYDAILMRQILGLVKDKAAFLAGLNNCLKPGGQIMVVEYALAKANADSPALQAWREVEDSSFHPPTLEFIAGALKHEKLDVRVAEDFAPEFKVHVLAGWARLAEEIKGKTVSPEEKPMLARELDLWARRIAACESGDLRLARVYAIKKT